MNNVFNQSLYEKDHYMCLVLDYLFNQNFKFKNHIIFKGGISLNKAHKVINRLSNDLDIILDWRLLGYDNDFPLQTRSNAAQKKLNIQIQEKQYQFLSTVFLSELSPLLPYFEKVYWNHDTHSIDLIYQQNYVHPLIPPIIKLEIGCLSSMQNYEIKEINSYDGKINTKVKVITLMRNFIEKLTILHKESLRTNGNRPKRYSRHYYDVYQILQNYPNITIDWNIAENAVFYNKKFYACNWAKYDDFLTKPLTFQLPFSDIDIYTNDYQNLIQPTIFDKNTVDFPTIYAFINNRF